MTNGPTSTAEQGPDNKTYSWIYGINTTSNNVSEETDEGHFQYPDPTNHSTVSWSHGTLAGNLEGTEERVESEVDGRKSVAVVFPVH